jgi:hypothetical protein
MSREAWWKELMSSGQDLGRTRYVGGHDQVDRRVFGPKPNDCRCRDPKHLIQSIIMQHHPCVPIRYQYICLQVSQLWVRRLLKCKVRTSTGLCAISVCLKNLLNNLFISRDTRFPPPKKSDERMKTGAFSSSKSSSPIGASIKKAYSCWSCTS